jgi:hypothetical protein
MGARQHRHAGVLACEGLLMSSEVHAKWISSAAALTSLLPAKRSRSQYSTAFTS